MQMTSFIFFAFATMLLLLLYMEGRYIHTERVRAQKITLLSASYIFMAYANIGFAVILALQSLVTWFCAKNPKRIKYGIIIMVLLLGVFKYANFFLSSFASLVGAENTIFLKMILPLGISFYTFSAIGYLVDIKRGKESSRSLTDVALYLSYFPKLTSGPIQCSHDFFDQINRDRDIKMETISIGIQIFAFGMFKKLVLADNLSVFVNQVYATPLAFNSATVFMAMIAYSFQIYFDFSGYSDMAIGVSKMMDVNLPNNFNLPYLAHNVTEFWKRWHITLSSWLQEYLYISMGGNRKGKTRTYINLILTMVIGGIWHGANWTYVVWGLLHGIGLCVHKIWSKVTQSGQKRHTLLSNLTAILTTFLFTSFCWIFFRAESITDAFIIIRQMIGLRSGIYHPYIWLFVAAVILIVSSLSAAAKSRQHSEQMVKMNQSYVHGYYPVADLRSFWGLVQFFVLVGLVFALAYTGGSPFIYGAY